MNSDLDTINYFNIENVNVEIHGHNDVICGYDWQYNWSFKDNTKYERLICSGPYCSLDEALSAVTKHIKIYGQSKSITLFTSYFNNIEYLKKYGYENLVSIAGNTPANFIGRKYLKLAPKYSWWKEWHDKNHSNDWYIQKYFQTVLNKLDPIQVIKELGDDAVLLCYEKPGEFCHRRLIADWFKNTLGIEVTEI